MGLFVSHLFTCHMLLALVQLLVFMCFFIWCFLQLLMNSLVVRVYHKRSFFELISFIELHWTSTWISPKVGNCHNLKKNTKEPKWFGKTFIGKMLPTPCWCHCWCCWKVPPSNSIFAPALIRETTTVWNPKGVLVGKFLGIFCLEINKTHKKTTTTTTR